MPSTRTAGDRRETNRLLASVNEAAYAAGVSRHAVNQAIDRGEIRTREPEPSRTQAKASGRCVGVPEIIYLRLAHHLSTRGRRVVYRTLTRMVASLDSTPPPIELEMGVRLDITGSMEEIRARLKMIEQTRRRVVVDPEIRGGEPVFRGTRIPVEMIASFVQQGVPAGEILEDYPALTPDALEMATRYVELYPRRGRPRQAPWRAQEPTHVIHPADPRG